MIYLTLACITFVYVFGKAFQQRNNIHNNWWMIPIIAYGMALCEISGIYLGVAQVIAQGWVSIIYITIANGTGGTLGCLLAMHLHNRYFK